MNSYVITHKETEFDFFSSELALQQMLFFVIFMQTVHLCSGLVKHSGYLIRWQVVHTGFTSDSSPLFFPFLFKERWAELTVMYKKKKDPSFRCKEFSLSGGCPDCCILCVHPWLFSQLGRHEFSWLIPIEGNVQCRKNNSMTQQT